MRGQTSREVFIFIYINNNILIYHLSYLGGYQCESESWELYEDIKIFLVEKKSAETMCHVTHDIINM